MGASEARVATGALARPAKRSPESVLLWADTFNNHFLPATAKAAAEVLEAAGFDVSVPRAHLCCGRPLYDVGMLDRAKHLLLQIMDELLPEIEAATPIVVLEPSCATVFRDELTNLFPKDERAQALSKQVFLLSEFLEQRAKDFPASETRAPRADPRPLPSQGHHEDDRRRSRARAHGHQLHRSRPRMLRHGWSLRLRKRQIRGLESDWRTRASARRPPGSNRLAHRRRRFQLPRADRPGNRPSRLAPRRSSADGTARSHRNSRRLPDVRSRAATLSRRRLGAAAPGSDRKIYEAHRLGGCGHSSRSGPAVGVG